MSINAKLVPSASTVVIRKAPDGGLQQSTSPVTLKNSIQSDAGRRLDSLVDVVADTAQTEAGSTLVYDSTTDTYIVKMLDINGGTF